MTLKLLVTSTQVLNLRRIKVCLAGQVTVDHFLYHAWMHVNCWNMSIKESETRTLIGAARDPFLSIWFPWLSCYGIAMSMRI